MSVEERGEESRGGKRVLIDVPQRRVPRHTASDHAKPKGAAHRQQYGIWGTANIPAGHGRSFSESQSGTSGILSGLGISQHSRSSSSAQKRKKYGETFSIQAKRSRSESSRRRLDITGLIKEEDDRFEEAIRHSIEQPNATSL